MWLTEESLMLLLFTEVLKIYWSFKMNSFKNLENFNLFTSPCWILRIYYNKFCPLRASTATYERAKWRYGESEMAMSELVLILYDAIFIVAVMKRELRGACFAFLDICLYIIYMFGDLRWNNIQRYICCGSIKLNND